MNWKKIAPSSEVTTDKMARATATSIKVNPRGRGLFMAA
jgi:hypothetical protein